MGLDVTVAIAATSEIDGYIVTVSDRRITWDDYSIPAADDGTLKGRKIVDRWGVLFSANDVAPIVYIVARARGLLTNGTNEANAGTVSDALKEAYRSVLHSEVVAHHLGRYGIKTIEEFRRDGFQQFGPDVLDRKSVV